MGGGGYFQFFTKNRPQKHQKRAILHTSQANGGARAPPATLLVNSNRASTSVATKGAWYHSKRTQKANL